MAQAPDEGALLFDQTLRFAELQRSILSMTSKVMTTKMLTQKLRQMKADGLILRQVHAQVPSKVAYWLIPLGASLRLVVEANGDGRARGNWAS